MTLKKVAGISIAALMAVMMTTTAQAAENGKYVQNSAGEAVKNSNEGTCVHAQFGSMPEGCEAAPPPPPPPPPPVPPPQPKKLVLNADANFDFDKSTLKPAGKANLDQFMAGLGGAKVSGITVVGHTDSVGTDAYNQSLSERRASSVANYLSSKSVPADAIQASGKGESQPVADNGSKAGRAQNRRVEIEATTMK